MRRGIEGGLPSVFALLSVALVAIPASALADAGAAERRKGPCTRCVSSIPDGDDPRPLLVLLHGDGETAASMFDAWQASAAARRIAVLALACPVSEGCTTQSWWRWNGDPAWLVRQTEAFGALRAIDPQQMWIVGWSGGASYIGFRTQEIERSFTAIVIHGGGMPPARSSCLGPKASVYFLVGDANPLHYLVERLHDHYEHCDDDVTWTLLKGVDHDGERRALAAHREVILDWLSTKRLRVPSESPSVEAGVESPPASVATAPLPVAPPIPGRSSCRCVCAGVVEEAGPWADAARWLTPFGAAIVLALRRLSARAGGRRSRGSAPDRDESGSCAPGPRMA